MLTLAVVGSRTCTSYELIEETLNKINRIDKILSGDARGANQLIKKYAESKNIPYQSFLPNWNKYGLVAGTLRNKSIVDHCDIVIAFWDGVSKGTLGIIKYARNINKPCFIIKC